MTKKLALLLLVLMLALSACQSATPVPSPTVVPTEAAAQPTSAPANTPVPTPEPIVLTDGAGREVTLPAPAQRVVSLAPSNTEILFAIGAGSQVVGRDMFSDYPEEAAGLADVGGSMGQYDTEAIVSLEPDLVLAAGITSPETVSALEELGLTVFVLGNPLTLEDMYANLKTVAVLTGHEAEADALVADLQARVEAVDAALADVTDRPTVFYELSADPSAPWTAGPGSFVDLLIQRAGGENVAAALDAPWGQMSLEDLLVIDPDFILLGDSIWGESPETVAARPGWEALGAVQSGNVLPFNDNLVSRPGPRLVDGLEALAKIFHPDLLP